MCSNYRAVTRLDRMLTFFAVEPGPGAPTEAEIWPLGLAPFIRRAESGERVAEHGQFGLLPVFAKELQYGRRTYNARSETVDQLASFRDSWKAGRRCVIPAEAIYEPNYESGKAVRWCIQQPGEVPLGIAGVYRAHPHFKDADGKPLWSFAMLTVNADGHVVFQRMHKPGDEKRMVIILDPAEYDDWLNCTPDQAKGYFRQWQDQLDTFPAPLAPRKSAKSKPSSGDPEPPEGSEDGPEGSLF